MEASRSTTSKCQIFSKFVYQKQICFMSYFLFFISKALKFAREESVESLKDYDKSTAGILFIYTFWVLLLHYFIFFIKNVMFRWYVCGTAAEQAPPAKDFNSFLQQAENQETQRSISRLNLERIFILFM